MNFTEARGWLIAAAVGGLLPVGASAADLPVKAKPVIVATFDWSGVYIGAHAGYGGGMSNWPPGGLGEAASITSGALAGGQVGINRQLGSFVFGMELAGSWADIDGQARSVVGFVNLPIITTDNRSKIDGLATIAGRAGLAADRWFVFAKAGLSAVHEDHSGIVDTPGGRVTGNGNAIRFAPILGFGSEYALSGSWSLFGEYNFHYLGERTIGMRGNVNAIPVAFDQRSDQSLHVVKAGVNYRWGGVAADPSYPAVRPVPGNDWSGGYIGAQAGYAWGHTNWPDGFGAPNPDIKTDGWLAGGTVGANAQAGSLVFGVEGEMLATGIKGGRTAAFPAGAGVQTNTYESKIDWLALATGRAGFAVGSNLLLYGKGGVAVAQEVHTLNFAQTAPANIGIASSKAIHTGVVAGAGAEYAFASNWSIKAEYNYVRMFLQQAVLTGTTTGGETIVRGLDKVGQDLHLVKFGVNYHFSPLPVVVAKY